MGERRDLLAENLAVALDVGRPHLEQVVEAPGDQMALLDLPDLLDRFVEAFEREFAGIGQLDLGKSDMVEARKPSI